MLGILGAREGLGMQEWGGKGGSGNRPRPRATRALALTCTGTETAVETSRDLLSEQKSQTSKGHQVSQQGHGTRTRLWTTREEGGESVTPTPAPLPARQDGHSVASCRCCSSRDSRRLALCTAACNGAQGRARSARQSRSRAGPGNPHSPRTASAGCSCSPPSSAPPPSP